VVQAAVRVHVHSAIQEPLQAGGVFEVQLVIDQRFESRPVQQVEERGVSLFARVIEGVLVRLRAVVK
jgi:hypothetical protein